MARPYQISRAILKRGFFIYPTGNHFKSVVRLKITFLGTIYIYIYLSISSIHLDSDFLGTLLNATIWLHPYTAILRKVVGKRVHATIPKGNMGYDRYTVAGDCSCRTYFCCFPLALANTFAWSFVPILSNFSEEQ